MVSAAGAAALTPGGLHGDRSRTLSHTSSVEAAAAAAADATRATMR